MMGADERRWVLERAWSVEHDFEIHSLYLGEPFLVSGLLCFFDGETLFVCCRGLDPRDRDRQTGADVLSRWSALHPGIRPRRINCWGDHVPHVDAFRDRGYGVAFHGVANPLYEELILSFDSEQAGARFDRRCREVLRRGRGLECAAVERRGYSWRELRVLRSFCADLVTDFDSIDLSYFMLTPALLAATNDARTVRVELRGPDGIVGIAFARILNERFAAVHFVAWDRACAGACDALYAGLLGEIRNRRIARCSLGVSMYEGLRRYKSKWGAEPVETGMEQTIWYCRDAPWAADLTAYHWPTALAQQYVAAVRAREAENGL